MTQLDPQARSLLEVVEARALASLLQTLGDRTRLRILTALETACVPVTAIVEATGARQPTVSHHLRILRDRGLVRGERRGGYVFYCLATDGLRAALDVLRPLALRGQPFGVHAVTADPAAQRVAELGLSSLPVLPPSDGRAAAGADPVVRTAALPPLAAAAGRGASREEVSR